MNNFTKVIEIFLYIQAFPSDVAACLRSGHLGAKLLSRAVMGVLVCLSISS